jgi:hypothetical protein
MKRLQKSPLVNGEQNRLLLCFYPETMTHDITALKGPKHEIFGSGFFTLIKLVWVVDLGTRTKNSKLGWFGPDYRRFVLFSAVGYSAEEF